jgi:hypothetical protein
MDILFDFYILACENSDVLEEIYSGVGLLDHMVVVFLVFLFFGGTDV